MPAGYEIIATEGGHMDFAPLDAIEDALVKRLRKTYTRVSSERVVAGPGIVAIYETLAEIEGKPVHRLGDKAIWELALEGEDGLAVAALDRFCMSLGAVAGDLALAHGPSGVVIAGGLGAAAEGQAARIGLRRALRLEGAFPQPDGLGAGQARHLSRARPLWRRGRLRTGARPLKPIEAIMRTAP